MNLELLKSARKTKGLSQAALAERLGIAQNTYSQYEVGTRRIYPELIPKIADILELTLDELLRGKSQSPQEFERELPQAADSLNPLNRDSISTLLSRLTKGDSPMMEEDQQNPVAAILAQYLLQHDATERMRIEKQAENERLRIEKVEAKLADTIHRLTQNDPHHEGRPDEEAVSGDA